MTRALNLVLIGLTCLFVPLLATGCRSNPYGDIHRETAADQIDIAEDDLGAGRLEDSIGRLVAVREVVGLIPEDRIRAEGLLELGVHRYLAELDESDHSDPEDYEDLFELELPPRLKATAGVHAAERMLAEGCRVDAVNMIKDVEEQVPTHTERGRAAEVLTEAGLDLSKDPGRYRLIYRYRTKGIDALDFLVLYYPQAPQCSEAYFALAQAYEDADDLDEAIARYEDMLLYHADSLWTRRGAARLPFLRMERLERDDNDRGELIRAREELEIWLATHALAPDVDTQLADWVRMNHELCLRRLAHSDRILARYYDQIGNPVGTRLHAERALVEAREAGFEPGVASAQAILDELAPAAEVAEPEPGESPR